MMTRETGFILTLIVLLVVGGAAGWFMIWFYRNHPLQVLRRKTTPELRQKWRRVPIGFVEFMKWQGAVDRIEGTTRNIAPGCGPHLLLLEPHRATLRAGGENYMRRVVLVPFFLFPLFAWGLWETFVSTMRFFNNPVHRDFIIDFNLGSVTLFEGQKYDAKLPDYLASRLHSFGTYFSDRSIEVFGFRGAIHKFLLSEPFFLLLLILTTLIYLATLLHRPAPPLVFDRKRQIVYTVHRGHLHAARWPEVKMTVAICGRNSAPVFALEDIEGGRGRRWFTMAAWGGMWKHSEAKSADEPHQWDRWKATRLWLLRFMENTDIPTETGQARGPIILLAPREGRLPDDLHERVDKVAHEGRIAGRLALTRDS